MTVKARNIQCPQCDDKFLNSAGLSIHLARKHGVAGLTHPKKTDTPSPTTFACPECPLSFKSRIGLGIHRKAIHGVSGFTLRKKAGIEEEKQSKPGTGLKEGLPIDPKHPTKCPECGHIAQTVLTLGVHRRFKHNIAGKSSNAKKVREKKLEALGGAVSHENSSSLVVQQRRDLPQAPSSGQGPAYDPLAYAITVGSVKELCRNAAEEHGIPTREFTYQFAQLFLRQARR